MNSNDKHVIRQLFDEYLQVYAARDHDLTDYFSDDFAGFTYSDNSLIKSCEEWVAFTRQARIPVQAPLRIDLNDLAIQPIADRVVVATGYLTIHVPLEDQNLAPETARLVLIFRQEISGWKIHIAASPSLITRLKRAMPTPCVRSLSVIER